MPSFETTDDCETCSWLGTETHDYTWLFHAISMKNFNENMLELKREQECRCAGARPVDFEAFFEPFELAGSTCSTCSTCSTRFAKAFAKAVQAECAISSYSVRSMSSMSSMSC